MLIVASIAPFWFSIGDHKAFIIDFPIDVILGKEFILIYRPQMHCLFLIQPRSIENYLQRVEQLFIEHKIEEKLENLDKSWGKLSRESCKLRLNRINKQVSEFLISAK